MKKFNFEVSTHRERFGGEQYIFEFENGYGASVVRFSGSYGGDKGLYELAVLHNGEICYDTPITNDVVGYLTDDAVEKLLEDIKNL